MFSSFEYSIPKALQTPHPLLRAQKWFLEGKEVDEIRQHLTKLDEEEETLVSTITKAKALVKCLKNKREELIDIKRRHNALIGNTRRCPPEIIASIMLMCTENDSREKPPHPRRAPLVFCSVSRQWRDLALSTPRLWKSITISIQTKCTWPKPELFASMVNEWLERSRSLGLSVCLTGRCDTKEVNQALDVLLRASERWSSLTVTAPMGTAILHKASFPKLKRVEIHHDASQTDDPFKSCSFKAATSLQNVTIVSRSAPCPPVRCLTWTNITDWSFRSTETVSALLLLQQAPQLQRYNIEMLNDPPVLLLPLLVVAPHESLRQLQLTCQTTIGLRTFCSGVKLPNLCSLSVTVLRSNIRDEPFSDDFWQFLAPCSSTLQHLLLNKNLCSVGLAQHFPMLTSLRSLHLISRSLSKSNLDDAFMESLLYDENRHGETLPLLEELRVQGILNFSCRPVVNFIRSRTQDRFSDNEGGIRPPFSQPLASRNRIFRSLKLLHVDIDTPFFSEQDLKKFQDLKELRNRGARITITYRGNHL